MASKVKRDDNIFVGTTVAGDYRVVAKVGEGGMGVVYLVEQMSVGARRALKLMRAKLVDNPAYRERFLREARIAAGIPSDHVVQVLGAGVTTGFPWILMEYLRGEDLAASAARAGPVGATVVAEILEQLCHGLAAAHDLGIVHRDLKPENIFLAVSRRTGVAFTVKILDFGIAKAVASATETIPVGSPGWMAPEQASGAEPIRPYTDVWPLGLIAFWLLTGKSYWLRASEPECDPMSLLYEAAFGDLPPASIRATQVDTRAPLPAGFDAWFARCVARAVGERFPDARAAMSALRPLLVPEGPARSPARPPAATAAARLPLPEPAHADAMLPFARTEPAQGESDPVLELRNRRPSRARRRVTIVVATVATTAIVAAASVLAAQQGRGAGHDAEGPTHCGSASVGRDGICIPVPARSAEPAPPVPVPAASAVSPEGGARTGTVLMTCTPRCTYVKVDGTPHHQVGSAPTAARVTTGTHPVEAKWPGIRPLQSKVSVRAGETQPLDLRQHPRPVRVATPSACGCPPGDLQCVMRCAAGGR